ncbi:GntR family transcriptional regulator [Kushneria phosphatilytica]|uniref:GntR family transcriptional regulator n=1 Tax=Kushneria phosphatilytica TaxID=657387 RepID=A0A5C1A602_9GAMM|nr:GntR family transcriptional regulator [Kushneria phosphatilytica]QEL12415.1 GntR family transcriptional regulator [Kushneria phosphatilytica]
MNQWKQGSDARLPLYQRLREEIMDRIASGEWPPDKPIPTEAALTQRYDVAVGTVRKAIDTLVHDGLLERSQGRGTFIRRPDFDASLFRFFRQVDAAGHARVPDSRILARTLEQPAEPIARALALPVEEQTLKLDRLRTLEDGSVLKEEIWLPATRFAPLKEIELERFGTLLYPFYESQCGQRVGSARETLTVETADQETAQALGIATGDPVVVIERVALGYDRTPLEYRRSRGPAATFRYQVEIS